MGLLVPSVYIDELDISLSNVYISAGQAPQIIQKVDSSYGCSTVKLTGTFSAWSSQQARLKDKNPVYTYTRSSNIAIENAIPFPIYYSKMTEMFPDHSNVFP